MRILLVAPPWVPVPPPSYGGTEAVLDTLARGLRAAGHEVVLYATGDSTCDVETQWTYRHAVGTERIRPQTELRHVVDAYRCALDRGVDVVHDHTVTGPLYGLRLGAPVVTTNHGPFDDELRTYYGAIGDPVPVVAISRHHASTAAPAPIAAVIHHGIDVDRFPPGDGDGGYAAFVGRMAPDKGVHRAARIARAAGVPLCVAGKRREPAEHEYFEREVAPLLGDGVVYLGEVGVHEKLQLLAGASCLLNPIGWPEPFGMVMIEALACGTPVVATPEGSVPEIVTDGETGFVRAGDAELAEALEHVASLDRRRCRSEAARRFSADRLVGDHVRLYETIGEQPRPLTRGAPCEPTQEPAAGVAERPPGAIVRALRG
jgi:glycosyltransferase involved in cell wall biosynthesis